MLFAIAKLTNKMIVQIMMLMLNFILQVVIITAIKNTEIE
jgi:hypothetical protein